MDWINSIHISDVGLIDNIASYLSGNQSPMDPLCYKLSMIFDSLYGKNL